MFHSVLDFLLGELLTVGGGQLVLDGGMGHVQVVPIVAGGGQGVAVLLGCGVLRGFGGGLGRDRGLLGGGDLRHLRLDRPFRGRNAGLLGGLGRGGRGLAALGSVVEGEDQDDEAGQHDLPRRLQPRGAPDGDDRHDGQEEYPQQHPTEGDLSSGLFRWQRLAVRLLRVRFCAAVGAEVALKFRTAAGAPVHERISAASWAKGVALLILGPAVFTDLHFFFLRN